MRMIIVTDITATFAAEMLFLTILAHDHSYKHYRHPSLSAFDK